MRSQRCGWSSAIATVWKERRTPVVKVPAGGRRSACRLRQWRAVRVLREHWAIGVAVVSLVSRLLGRQLGGLWLQALEECRVDASPPAQEALPRLRGALGVLRPIEPGQYRCLGERLIGGEEEDKPALAIAMTCGAVAPLAQKAYRRRDDRASRLPSLRSASPALTPGHPAWWPLSVARGGRPAQGKSRVRGAACADRWSSCRRRRIDPAAWQSRAARQAPAQCALDRPHQLAIPPACRGAFWRSAPVPIAPRSAQGAVLPALFGPPANRPCSQRCRPFQHCPSR
jgi:hypothetical protein